MNRHASLAVLFTTAALLAACGGNGDSSFTSPSPSPAPSPEPAPAPPPMQTDLADAKKTQLNGYADQVSGLLTLQWVDTFPAGSSYIVQSKQLDGTFATMATIQGQGGQSKPMTWQHSPDGLTAMRIEAIDQGRFTPIETASGADKTPCPTRRSSPTTPSMSHSARTTRSTVFHCLEIARSMIARAASHREDSA